MSKRKSKPLIYLVEGGRLFKGDLDAFKKFFSVCPEDDNDDFTIFRQNINDVVYFSANQGVYRHCRDTYYKLEVEQDGKLYTACDVPTPKKGLAYMAVAYGNCHENTTYDQDWSSTLLVSQDLSAIQNFLEDKRRQDAEHNKILETFHQKMHVWHEENPSPSRGELEDFPRWRSGIRQSEITPEMRAEREAIKARNNVIMEEWKKLQDERDKRKKEYETLVLNELGVSPEDHDKFQGFRMERRHRYRVDIIPFV